MASFNPFNLFGGGKGNFGAYGGMPGSGPGGPGGLGGGPTFPGQTPSFVGSAPTTQGQGSNFSWSDPGSWDWGKIFQIGGAGLGAYGQYKNTQNANKKSDNISQLIMQLMGANSSGAGNPGNIQSILKTINPGNDALMQFLNADPSRQFDTSSAFKGLEANDQRQINLAADQTRAGYAGLGQRFGTAAQGIESRQRGDFAAQIAARNAGLSQSSFEAAQGRSMNAAQLFSQLSSGIYGQGQSQMTNLLAIMAGLPPAQSGAGAIGGGIQDVGQILALWPILQSLGKSS